MDLDRRQADRQQRVEQRDGGVGIAARVDQDAARPAAAFLHPGHQFALAVGLAEVDGDVEPLGRLHADLLHVVQRRPAVDRGFAQAQHVEVGAVQHGDQGWRHRERALACRHPGSKSAARSGAARPRRSRCAAQYCWPALQ